MKGYLFTIGAAFVYASQVIIGKYILTAGAGVWTLVFLQLAISTVVMFLASLTYMPEGFKAKFTVQKKDLGWILLLGLTGGFGANFFLYSALAQVDAGIGSMLLFLHPVVICLFFMLTGIRKLTRINIMALVAVLLGSVLVLNLFGESHSWTWLGILYGLLCCFNVAAFFLILDLKVSHYPISTIYFYDWLAASIFAFLLNPGVFSAVGALSLNMILLIVFVSSVTTVLPGYLMAKGVVLIGSERATVIGTLELPLTVLLAFLFLSEVMVPLQILGVFVVIAAVAALSLEGSRRSKEVTLETRPKGRL